MNAEAQVNAVIVPDACLVYDVIVGRDFIEQDHIIAFKRGKELSFEQFSEIKNEPEKEVGVNFLEKVEESLIRIGNVDRTTRQQCISLIQKFGSCVSTSIKELGRTDAVSMSIRCTSEEPIVYWLAEPERRVLRGIVKDLLATGIIQESCSPYASPVILIKKGNGDYRMCVDFRKLNAITVKDKYPMPRIEDQIDKLGDNRYFTGLDLASGYYQVPMAAESIEKTAFVTPEGHYEFLRMPFGLTNAPAVFQRLMDRVLGTLKDAIAFPYLDDVIIPSKTLEDGMRRLRQVLEVFRANRLTLNLKKCTFFTETIEYLGREISEQGVRPGRQKIEAVLHMEAPRSVK